jgi:peptidoglycan biosynthesis protein MviN/MurJ (putative lipid II flippase)
MSQDQPNKDRAPIPAGYRQGVISAITVVLGFSLVFMRYWSFGTPGEWDALSIVAALSLVAAILLELYALWRALRLEDNEAGEYRKTLRWFVASVVVLIMSLVLAQVWSSWQARFGAGSSAGGGAWRASP